MCYWQTDKEECDANNLLYYQHKIQNSNGPKMES